MYKSIFNDKKYIHTNIQGVYNKHEDPIMDKKTFVQVLEKIFEQMSFKTGVKKFGDDTVKKIIKKFEQFHFRNSFNSKKKFNLQTVTE